MCDVCVQSMHQRRSLENNANPCMAMTVNPSLVTLGQPKPTLQLKIVRDLLKLTSRRRRVRQGSLSSTVAMCWANRILSPLELINQLFKLLLAIRTIRCSRFKGCGYFLDVFHVVSDCLLFGPNFVQSLGRCSQRVGPSCFSANPFFLVQNSVGSTSRTSSNASVIRRPGG